MFHNIPGEMRQFNQWVVWRLERKYNSDGERVKDTKVPYNVRTGNKASVTDPTDWSDYVSVISVEFSCKEACGNNIPVSVSGFSGIGFVFTSFDPFAGIDLDDTHGIKEDYERQLKIFHDFDSYSEISQSGLGLHIIVRGKVSRGRRRSGIEIYSTDRFFALTGNVYANKYSINDRQTQLTNLWEQLGGPIKEYTYEGDGLETETDKAILEKASKALNGEKFSKLWEGDFSNYPSQSEADFALVDIIAFYTQNRQQIKRLFAASALGKTPKDGYAHRSDRAQYVEYMINKSFDRQLPPIDITGLKDRLDNEKEKHIPVYNLPDPYYPTNFPPGLIGEIAQYIYDNSPTPVAEIALAGAMGLVGGIVSRAYNISGTGLNQYILLLAQTGTGKEAMANGIANLMNSVLSSVPAATDFKGPGEIVSLPGLIRCFEKTPCLFSIIGEFGLKLKLMASPHIHHLSGVQTALLQLYNKSGKSNVFDFTSYSDRTKNIPIITAPSFTLLGESTPESFYDNLDESMISSGLLPRFLIVEYKGLVPYYNTDFKQVAPPFYLVEKLATLCGICLGRQSQNTVANVVLDPEAKAITDEYSRFATDIMNKNKESVFEKLYNRAHIKALKLAAVISVGIDPINPVVTKEIADYSIKFVNDGIETITSKFEKGEIGVDPSSETKQMRDLKRIIVEFATGSDTQAQKYLVPYEMWKDGVIPHSAILRRLTGQLSYKNDKLGATNAIKRHITTLLDSDDIKEIPKAQMNKLYGTSAKAYVVVNIASLKGLV